MPTARLRFTPEEVPAGPLGRPVAVTAAWLWRLLDALTTYLPVLLLAVLALLSWWLVKSVPLQEEAGPQAPLRHEPDYTMRNFLLQRFAADGGLRLEVRGEQLRHYPDTDTIEIDAAQLRFISPEGRVTQAQAQRASGNADASEFVLQGKVHVLREASGAEASTDFKGESLQVDGHAGLIRSTQPVTVVQGARLISAGGVRFDQRSQRLEFSGPVRAVLTPAASKR